MLRRQTAAEIRAMQARGELGAVAMLVTSLVCGTCGVKKFEVHVHGKMLMVVCECEQPMPIGVIAPGEFLAKAAALGGLNDPEFLEAALQELERREKADAQPDASAQADMPEVDVWTEVARRKLEINAREFSISATPPQEFLGWSEQQKWATLVKWIMFSAKLTRAYQITNAGFFELVQTDDPAIFGEITSTWVTATLKDPDGEPATGSTHAEASV